MAELSATNLVLIDLDPDSGDPSGLKVGLVGDTIASSTLTRNIRNVVSAVEDTSATWDEGGDPSAAGFENWNDTSTVVAASSDDWNQSRDRVKDSSNAWDAGGDPSAAGFENWNSTSATLNAFSGSVETSTATLDTSTDALNAFSGSVDTSVVDLDTSTDALNVWSGSVDTSVVDLDTSTDALNAFSGSVETSTATLDTDITAIDTRVGTVEGQVPSAVGFANWNLIYGDRANILTTSADVVAIGGPSAVGFSDWDRTRDYVTQASTTIGNTSTFVFDGSGSLVNASSVFEGFSGSVETSTAILDTSTDALNAFSGSVDTSTATLDSNITAIDTRVGTVEGQVPSAVGFSDWDRTRDYVTQASTTIGNTSTFVFDGSGSLVNASSVFEGFSSTVEASTATLDTSTDALNAFSGSVETSTTTIDGRVVTVEAQVPSATGFAGWNSTKTTVDAGASNWDAAYSTDLFPSATGYSDWNDAATWANVSSTKSLGGTAPAATVSAITVSACPVPAPWAYLRITVAGTDAEQNDYYIGSGVAESPSDPTVAVTAIDSEEINWDSTYPYFNIVNAGYYHVSVQASFLVDASPTTITLTLATNTGSPGWVDTDLTQRVQVIRQNIDPQDQVIEWMGYLAAGVKLLCHVEVGGSNSAASRIGTSFSVRRIN